MISPILANAGLPFTIFMLNLPFRSSIATFGLAGLGIILLEAWGIYKRESLDWKNAIWQSFSMNIFSTLMGFLFSAPYVSGGTVVVLFATPFLLSWFLSNLVISWLAEHQNKPQSLLIKLIIYLISFVLSFNLFMSAAKLNFDFGNRGAAFRINAENHTINNYITATIGLLIINFLLTLILESFWLIQHLKGKSSSQLCRTVFWVNVRSYIYILLPALILGGILQTQFLPPDNKLFWRF